MAKQTLDVVTQQRLAYFKEKYDEKVTKDLGPYAKTQDVEGAYVKNETLTSTLEGYVEDADLESYTTTEDLQRDYLKTATAETTYAKTEKVTQLESTLTELSEKAKGALTLADDTVKTKEDLTTLKDSAVKGDMYIISDDDNHFYVYLGAEVDGCDENGFYDLGTHVDLTGYAKTEDLDNLTEITTEAIDAMFTE